MMTLIMVLVLLAQAGAPSAQSPMTQNRAPVPAQPAPMTYPESASIDHTFALAAIQGNNAEIDMAQLALKRGTANEVKGYAGKMIAEHGGLMKEMEPVLRSVLGAAPPPERLAAPDMLAMRHLESVSPADFDQAYVMQQVGNHLATLTAFHTVAENGTNPQLKALARKWTPTIQAHLELAVDLTEHIGGASPLKSH